MDQGINLPFSSAGIDDVTFGLPTFSDGWKGLVITGSSTRALNDNKGGRLLLNVKCVNDPAGVDNGKDHIISLNLWHNDENTMKRAKSEMATIMRAIFGNDRQINNTAELYNMPFYARAVTQTSAPTPQYPNPQPQTNWRGYATQAGLGVNCDGPNGRLGGGAGGGAPNGAPQGFNGGGAPQGGPQGFQQPPQGQSQGGGGGWDNNQQPQNQQPQQGNNGWGGPGNQQPQQSQQPNNGGDWGGGGQNQQPQQPQGGGGQGWGPQGGGQQPQQPQQPNNGGGGWGPQGGGAGQPQGGGNGWG